MSDRSLEYINKHYRLKLRIGDIIKFDDAICKVVGAEGVYLKIQKGTSLVHRLIHPRWRVQYLPEQELDTENSTTKKNMKWKTYKKEQPSTDGYYLINQTGEKDDSQVGMYYQGEWSLQEFYGIKVIYWCEIPRF